MIACCGGFRYRPTTSVIFSRNFGSRESLKVSVRCGCRLWARQILLTVDLLTPWLCAIVRQLQRVITAGLVCRVASTMAAILSIWNTGFRPLPGATSHRPSSPSSPKRFRHRITVFRFTETRFAIVISDSPAAAARTIRQRKATCCGVPCAAVHCWIFCRSASQSWHGLPMLQDNVQLLCLSSYLLDTTLGMVGHVAWSVWKDAGPGSGGAESIAERLVDDDKQAS